MTTTRRHYTFHNMFLVGESVTAKRIFGFWWIYSNKRQTDYNYTHPMTLHMHQYLFTWAFREANWASRLLCRSRFRVAQHDVFDGDVWVEWCDSLVETLPSSEGQNMCATTCVSIITWKLEQSIEAREYGFQNMNYTNNYVNAPDSLARQKSSTKIDRHKLDTRLVVGLSFL